MTRSLTDRRFETRINICAPLTFRPVTSPPSGQHIAETVNLSPRGLCLLTEVPLRLGTMVEVFMTMPTEISGLPPGEVRCIAQVMHIKPGGLSAKASIGLHIERYESVVVKDRWVS